MGNPRRVTSTADSHLEAVGPHTSVLWSLIAAGDMDLGAPDSPTSSEAISVQHCSE